MILSLIFHKLYSFIIINANSLIHFYIFYSFAFLCDLCKTFIFFLYKTVFDRFIMNLNLRAHFCCRKNQAFRGSELTVLHTLLRKVRFRPTILCAVFNLLYHWRPYMPLMLSKSGFGTGKIMIIQRLLPYDNRLFFHSHS